MAHGKKEIMHTKVFRLRTLEHIGTTKFEKISVSQEGTIMKKEQLSSRIRD